MVYLIIFIINLMTLCVSTFHLMDVMDMPFMEIFDTNIPLNGLFWCLFWVLYMINMSTCIDNLDKLVTKLRKN